MLITRLKLKCFEKLMYKTTNTDNVLNFKFDNILIYTNKYVKLLLIFTITIILKLNVNLLCFTVEQMFIF